MVEKRNKEKEQNRFTILIGKKLREVLDLQKERIREVTHGVCNASDYEAGEIVAKKVLGEI